MQKEEAEATETEASEEKGNEDEGDEEKNADDNGEESRKPTPWAELDVKAMKVNDLREELQARGLNTKGLKSQLVGRLQKAIKEEQEKETKEEEKDKDDQKMEIEDQAKEGEGVEKKAEADDDVMEIVSEEGKVKDDEIFTKPKAVDEKTKQSLMKAYKMPGN